MRLFRRRSQPEPGSVYEGLTTYTTDPYIGPPGFYALEDDGHTINPNIRLTWIDEAPGSDEDGSGHYIVADPDQPYYSHLPAHVNSNLVELEAKAQGSAKVAVGGDEQ